MRGFVPVSTCLALTCLAGASRRTRLRSRSSCMRSSASRSPLLTFPSSTIKLSASAETTCSRSLLVRDRIRFRTEFGRSFTSGSKPTASGSSSGKWLPSLYDSQRGFLEHPDLDCEGPLAAFSTQRRFLRRRAHERRLASDPARRSGQGIARRRLPRHRRDRGKVALADDCRARAQERSRSMGRRDLRSRQSRNESNSPESVGPRSMWVAATEIGATGDDYEPPESPGEQRLGPAGLRSDRRVLACDDAAAALPRVGAVINDRLALQLDEWTEPGTSRSYFVRDAAGALDSAALFAQR